MFGGVALAQQATDKVVRIGWASVYPLAQVETFLQAFRNGLAAHGYVEGRNLELVLRSAEGVRERVPALLDELVGQHPDVIVSTLQQPLRLGELQPCPWSTFSVA